MIKITEKRKKDEEEKKERDEIRKKQKDIIEKRKQKEKQKELDRNVFYFNNNIRKLY